MMRVEVVENGQVERQLTSEQGHMLAASNVVTASPLPHDPEMWRIKPRSGLVGVAQVGDMEVWIEPKLPIARLLFLAGYANGRKPLGWRDDNVTLDVAEGLVPVVARLLCHQAEQALVQGPLKGYRTVEESSAVLRGRLRKPISCVGITAARSRWRSGMTISPSTYRRTRSCSPRSRGWPTCPECMSSTGPGWPPYGPSWPASPPPSVARTCHFGTRNRLNQRYHAVLRLAEVIWQATSPEHVPGSLLANGFLFNLWKIFEDFLVAALSEELQARHGGLRRGHPCHLDQACAVEMKPDLVWQVNGQPVAVVDAKYKPEKPSGYPYADLYQVLAYCTALLRCGCGCGPSCRHRLRRAVARGTAARPA